MLLACKRGRPIDDAAMLEAMRQHFRAHVAAYGDKAIVPKFHHQMHIPEQAKTLGVLLDTWCVLMDTWALERKRQIPKQFAQSHDSPNNYERRVLQLVLLDQDRRLKDAIFGDGLLGELSNSCMLARVLGATSVNASAACIYKGQQYTVGDFVLIRRDRALEISSCCLADDRLVLLGRVFDRVTPTGATFALRDQLINAHVLDEVLEIAAAWANAGQNRMVILTTDI